MGDERVNRLELSARTIHRSARAPYPPAPPARGARRGRRGLFVALGVLLVVVVVLGAGAVALVVVDGEVGSSADALASIGLPLGGGTIERVRVLEGPRSKSVPIDLRGESIWPRGQLPAGKRLTVEAVIRRPGWVAWLTGSTERVHRSVVTPVTSLREQDFTLARGAALRLPFTAPVAAISYGPLASQLRRHVLDPPTEVTVPHEGIAGSLYISAVARTWENAPAEVVSWFPPGAASDAVVSPAPGSRIQPGSPLTVTFSETVAKALGRSRPVISPGTPGSWREAGPRTLVFRPAGYGYGLGVTVTMSLPSGVRIVGGRAGGGASSASWTVPPGSTLRLQQLLAELGYLPFEFRPRGGGVAHTAQAEENAAANPPAGSFRWRYGDVPAPLRSYWHPGEAEVMTKGAVMAFENESGMDDDGIAGPAVWRALLGAAIAGRRSTFGYTFVDVSKGAQQLTLWHDGRVILTTPVNTGISSAPTEAGTFPVYEHIRSGTMSGTNPDGSHYEDPGVPFISYFNGGDALHGFERAQYGFPQSLGCVEMPPATAGRVWPYTPVGTLVDVHE